MAVVFGAIGTAWSVVVWKESIFFEKKIGVDLISELTSDGEESRWGLCRGACFSLAVCCVSCRNVLGKTGQTYNASIFVSSMVRRAVAGDGNVWELCFNIGGFLSTVVDPSGLGGIRYLMLQMRRIRLQLFGSSPRGM